MSFAAKVLSHKSPRRRHLIGHALLSLAVVWSLLWVGTAYYFNKKIEGWIAAQKEQGWVIQYAEHYTNGSPFAVHVHYDGLTIETKSGKFLKATESVLYLSLWNWRDADIKLRHGVQSSLLGKPFEAETVKMGLRKPKKTPNTHNDVGLAFWVQPFGMTLPDDFSLPIGKFIEEAYFDVRVMGPAPDITNPDSLKTWTDLGGVIEFDQFYLRTEMITLIAAGTMGLDQSLQPQGAFSARIDGLDKAVSSLIQSNGLDKRQETMLHYTLKVMARPSGLLSGAAPLLPLTMQNRGLFIGPVRIWTAPEIKW